MKGEEIRVAEDETELCMSLEEIEEARINKARVANLLIDLNEETLERSKAEDRVLDLEEMLYTAKRETEIARNCYESEKKRRGEKILAAQVREEEKKKEAGAKKRRKERKGEREGPLEVWGGL